ncbi:hypothetical protein [Pectobacterium aroidearum]|uniref:hypothetical protein n=1 Tax=Pectobacterium aroidearum TaxID=1201031 RepID=UPI0015DF22C3|nr:hypothetical protein [Pectobacterium aroidearum]MBA0204142.1 hypothetical protein [Pectobacterium aroidearum]
MTKNIWQENKILPLEYLSIGRAAKLLSCEVDDIWHWSEQGIIRLCVNIPWGPVVGVVRFRVDTPSKEFIEAFNERRELDLGLGESIANFIPESPEETTIKTEIYSGSKLFAGPHDGYFNTQAILCGLWAVPEISRSVIPRLLFPVSCHEWVKDLCVTIPKPPISKESDLLLTGAELERIHGIIHDKPSPINSLQKNSERESASLKMALVLLLKNAGVNVSSPSAVASNLDAIAEKHGYSIKHSPATTSRWCDSGEASLLGKRSKN